MWLTLNIFIIIILALTQVGFWSIVPFFQIFNFVLLFIIYLSIRANGRMLLLAIIGGYVLDIFSSYPFGLHIFAYMLTGLAATYVYSRVLTNHRFFPVIILTAASIVFYHIILIILVSAMSFLKLTEKIKLSDELIIKNLGKELIYTVIAGSLLYFIYYFARKKNSSHFLRRPYASK